MMATSHFNVFSGSDSPEEPTGATSTSASSWHEARVPMKRRCLEGSFHGLCGCFRQTILKVICAEVAIESSAAQRG
jgi:hypothetical protein